MENQSFYKSQIASREVDYAKAKKKYQLIGTLRLLTFASIFACAGVFWGSVYLIIPCTILFAIFLFLVHRSVEAKYARDKAKILISINEEECAVLAGDWSCFKGGNEFKNTEHAYAHDMDLFGKKSIFQLLNRTVSKKGSMLLANQLMEGVSDPELSNKAIQELSGKIDWCQEFIAEGKVFDSNTLEKEFQNINQNSYSENNLSKLLRITLPIASVSMTILFSFDLISSSVFGIYMVFNFALIGRNLKKANSLSRNVTAFSSQVKMFQRQLNLYQAVDFKTEKMVEFKAALFTNEDNLIQSLQNLEKIQNRMDSRGNLLVGLLLNFFFAWDYLVLFQWENWRTKNESKMGTWEFQLAQLEVWISGAVYKFNFPETNFAHISDTNEISIADLGHPFVSKEKRVVNAVNLKENENFMIITGPNMAGKSTYLRSLGFAIISANAGFPVLSSECNLPKMKLYSSMRTSDDLTVERSYFHAELTRLRFVMDAVEGGEKVFVILDEILKGTNSKDKEIGSAKFLQKLKRLNAKGVIATHDLSLCNLATSESGFNNMYFDSTISGKELSFDYKIRKGICQNMNASFLLSQMNLVD